MGASLDSGADAAAGEPVHERLYRSALSSKSRCSEDSRADESCSFKPQIDPHNAARFAHAKGHYTGARTMDNIRQELDRKEELLRERRMELEERERAECTFAPEVWKAYEEPQRPVVVSGLG